MKTANYSSSKTNIAFLLLIRTYVRSFIRDKKLFLLLKNSIIELTDATRIESSTAFYSHKSDKQKLSKRQTRLFRTIWN